MKKRKKKLQVEEEKTQWIQFKFTCATLSRIPEKSTSETNPHYTNEYT